MCITVNTEGKISKKQLYGHLEVKSPKHLNGVYQKNKTVYLNLLNHFQVF